MKIVLVDTKLLFRSLLERHLSIELHHEVCGGADNGEDGLNLIQRHSPDVVILDPILPRISGFQIAQKLTRERSRIKLLGLYAAPQPFVVDRMRRSGFHGCLHKHDISLEEFDESLNAMAGNGSYFCKRTCQINEWLKSSADSFSKLLSRREQQILSFIGAGMGNQEVANLLKVSPATVQTHRRNLFRKLSLHDTPSLMRYAIDHGFWNPLYVANGLDPATI